MRRRGERGGEGAGQAGVRGIRGKVTLRHFTCRDGCFVIVPITCKPHPNTVSVMVVVVMVVVGGKVETGYT